MSIARTLPPPVEEIDPEFGQLIQRVVSGSLPALVWRDRVFKLRHKWYPGERSHSRIVGEVELSIGRNDPCFCGSGRKFKKCCSRLI